MKQPIQLLLLVLLISCSTKKNAVAGQTEASYGYTEENAIKVGGVGSGPKNERDYLNSLSGPNGEQLLYTRRGSCCAFETKNSPFGGGMLDIYEVTYEGKGDTVNLYINMYDKDKLKAPVGFKFIN